MTIYERLCRRFGPIGGAICAGLIFVSIAAGLYYAQVYILSRAYG